MNKRICPKCLARWYSAASSDEAWICAICKSEIPKSQESVAGAEKYSETKLRRKIKEEKQCMMISV